MFILISTFLFLNFSFAENIFLKSQDSLTVFQDSASAEHLLVINKDKVSANIYDMNQNAFLYKEMTIDDDCFVINKKSNAIISSLSPAPFVYVHPYLTNAKTTCLVDLEKNNITFIGESSPPKDHFSLIFLSQTEEQIHFLLNRREYPTGKYGELYIKTISKTSYTQSIELVVNHIPGLSGAMIQSQDNLTIYYTMATGMNSNVLYEIKTQTLLDLKKTKKINKFDEVSSKSLKPFSGLSFSLYQTSDFWIYYNHSLYGNYESYVIDKKSSDKTVLPIEEGCIFFGIFQEGVLLNCKERGLKKVTI